MEKRKNENIKEIVARNEEKIDMIMHEIEEIQKKLECIIKMKEELAVHRTYFKILGVLSGGLLSLIVGIVVKLL
ncbi:MAG: hypothetical protein QW673_00690 [Candidatus Thermoplasmatota archaeon]